MSAAPRPAILIPAAGASARMRGRDKLLEPVRGRALLADRVVAAAAAMAGSAPPAEVSARPATEIIVTLPPRAMAPRRWAALSGSRAQLVDVPEAREGLAASLRAAVAALPATCPGLMILPADMPDISADDIARLLAGFDGKTILRGAGADGCPGHPVLFPARDFARLAALRGDLGGRNILKEDAARVRLVPLPGRHALTDLDTPEDWAAWRGTRPDQG